LFTSQLINNGYAVDGLATVDPIDWDVCHLLDAAGHSFHFDCDFSSSPPYIISNSIHYVLDFTQTQSIWLDGYHLAKLTFDYPWTILNDSSCLPLDLFCSHVNIANRKEVHDAVIQFAESARQDPGQAIAQVTTSNITTNSAVVSWVTQDDTSGGQVQFSTQPPPIGSTNFINTYLIAHESGTPGKSHSVTLPGLQSNQTYYFKVQVTPPGAPSPISSATEWFHTTPTVPSVRAISAEMTLGTAAATLEFVLANSGAPATGVSITSAKIGANSTTTQLPLAISDLGPVQSPLITLIFPKTVGIVGSTVVPVITLKYSGGTITIGVPPIKIQ
jgi:hypothetical protein